MALWQVTFALLPNKLFAHSAEMSDAQLEAYLTGAESAYAGFRLRDGYEEQIEVLFGDERALPTPAEHWGDPSSDDFTILRRGDSIEWIEARLDVRKLDDVLIGGVLLMANAWDCTLVEVGHRMVCRFNVTEMRQMLTGHVANRAVKDPATWLPYLADRAARPEA